MMLVGIFVYVLVFGALGAGLGSAFDATILGMIIGGALPVVWYVCLLFFYFMMGRSLIKLFSRNSD